MPTEPARRDRMSDVTFAAIHGAVVLFAGLTALLLGGRWALDPRAEGTIFAVGGAAVGLVGVFFGARRLLRLLHRPPIVTDSDVPPA